MSPRVFVLSGGRDPTCVLAPPDGTRDYDARAAFEAAVADSRRMFPVTWRPADAARLLLAAGWTQFDVLAAVPAGAQPCT